MSNSPIEPNADIRVGVIMIRGLFEAYVDVGFTEAQALDLVKTHIRAGSSATP